MKKTLIKLLILSAFAGIGYVTVSWIRTERKVAREMNVKGRFDQLAFSLRKYHANTGIFPPRVYREYPEGPEHSWRVLILPDLDLLEFYKKYSFKEPWNSPVNSELAKEIKEAPGFFRSPFSDNYSSMYSDFVALAPEQVGFARRQGLRTFRVSEGDAEFFLAEIPNSTIHWMEPRDE